MKLLVSAVILFFTGYLSATDFKCEGPYVEGTSENGFVSTWPYLTAGVSKKVCSGGQCAETMPEYIMTEFEICDQHLSVRNNCKINESNSFVKVSCSNGTGLEFFIDQNSNGLLSCKDHNTVLKEWQFVDCKQSN